MRPVESKSRLVERTVSRVAIRYGAVCIVFPERLTPRVRHGIAEAMRQALRDLDLKGVVCRTARIGIQRHTVELRIEHEEILRKQPAVPNEAAALARDAGVAVQEVREASDISIG